jgi:hypothetical protein
MTRSRPLPKAPGECLILTSLKRSRCVQKNKRLFVAPKTEDKLRMEMNAKLILMGDKHNCRDVRVVLRVYVVI